MDFIADAAIPALVWLLMLVVGLEQTPADFRRVFEYPRAVALATLGQLLLLLATLFFLVELPLVLMLVLVWARAWRLRQAPPPLRP